MRDNFTFYRSFAEGLEGLDDATFRRLMDAIIKYALNDEMPDLNGLELTVFQSWKANVDASNKRKDNGRLGGRKPVVMDVETIGYGGLENPEPVVMDVVTNGYYPANHRLCNAKPNININKNIKENKNLKENDKENKNGSSVRFTPPTNTEVREYSQEHGYQIDVERFIDFYESKGWMVGKNKMKDWKAAVRNWSRSQKGSKFNNFEQRTEEFDPYAMGLFANN